MALIQSRFAAALGVEAEALAVGIGGVEIPVVASDSALLLNVMVSEGAAGLQVVAAMPDINPDVVGRLRRIAESLAREFGLGLAEFSLNGVVIDAPSSPDRSRQWR